MAWSVATLAMSDCPLIEAISSQAIPSISAYNPQHLSNIAWAFAILGYEDPPFFYFSIFSFDPENS